MPAHAAPECSCEVHSGCFDASRTAAQRGLLPTSAGAVAVAVLLLLLKGVQWPRNRRQWERSQRKQNVRTFEIHATSAMLTNGHQGRSHA
jgi:hypothetical protein